MHPIQSFAPMLVAGQPQPLLDRPDRPDCRRDDRRRVRMDRARSSTKAGGAAAAQGILDQDNPSAF
jgi:hypothetical protein